jgi:cathepsin L
MTSSAILQFRLPHLALLLLLVLFIISLTMMEHHNSPVQQWDITAEELSIEDEDAGDDVPHSDDRWQTWKNKHEGAVTTSTLGIDLQDPIEEMYRRKIFEENVQRFESRGCQYILDEYAIMNKEEFRVLGKAECAKEEEEQHVLTNFACPTLNADDIKGMFAPSQLERSTQRFLQSKEIDYRATQVTPVKRQGPHGTCWSFAFVETIEGLNVRQGNALVNISNQEVIDCCARCRGSNQDASYHFVMQNRHVHGLDIKGRMATDDSYPYSGKNSPHNCWAKIFRSELAPVKVGGCVRVNDDSVKSGEPIYFALSLLGPAALGIDASCLQGYSGGVITNCTDHRVDHAVLLVGAGVDEDSGVPYFRIKNSWGPKWGEDGYFRISQKGGQMGFTNVVFARGWTE